MWDEVVWQGNTYLRCQLLELWAHGFFTRQFTPQTPDELVQILSPSAQVYRVKQVHGNRVLTSTAARWGAPSTELAASIHLNPNPASDQGTVTQPMTPLTTTTPYSTSPPRERLTAAKPPGVPPVTTATPSPYAHADGLVSDDPNQAVWVCTADCTPVLIADRRTGQVAAVHAGWRGTAQKIVPEAIAQLQTQGSELADLVVAMGPAIAGDAYQVTTDVAAQVGRTVATSTDPVAELADLAEPPILPDTEPDRVRLDVRRINALQLAQLGLTAAQVAIAPHCTYQNPDQFFSYRRSCHQQVQRAGQVQWSGIVSRVAARSD